MTVPLLRALWLWAGLLAVALIAVLPVTGWGVVEWVTAVALVVALGWMWAGRHVRQQGETWEIRTGATLPPSSYQKPIALVCGEDAHALFEVESGDSLALRLSDTGCYLCVPQAQRIADVVSAVLALRPQWTSQLCIIVVINPAEHAASTGLGAELKALRHHVALARRRGVALPMLIASYIPAGEPDSPWLGWSTDSADPWVLEQGARLPLATWQRNAPDVFAGASRARSAVQWHAAMAWLAERVVAPLTDNDAYDPPCVAHACGVLLLPERVAGVSDNLWQRWLGSRSGLLECAPEVGDREQPLPLPDALLGVLSIQPHLAPVQRASAVAVWLFAATGVIALISCAWQNTLLARRVSDDLRRYQAVRDHGPTSASHESALAALLQHATVLDGYYRHGEPVALGLGLYRGEQLRVPVRDALAAINASPVAGPAGDAIQLDSLSLFAVGSATLKPESTAVLINALSTIRARPGWLILITGHTDAAGHPEQNQMLSLARAGAVRDWIQQMGSVPGHCFAIQGMGASQPISDNDTEKGRAANRRVDIRLVPEPGACLPALDPAHRAPQSAVFTLKREGVSHGYSRLFVAAG